MIVTTTSAFEGREIREYKGIVVGETVMGANVMRDIFAAFTDFFGGRSSVYEMKFKDARTAALKEIRDSAHDLGADAVVGVAFDYEVIGKSMLMVSVTGTAVRLG